jgi:hypothetical protein
MPKKKNNDGTRLSPPKAGVTVRMYHTGFGDCFLLAFRAVDGKARYMLIDCGVHHQYDGGNKRLERVAQDIVKATGNKLHIVAITHEHADHLYGFMHGKTAFKDMEIDDLWLAWTEDPTNPVAVELKDLCSRRIRALQAAIAHLKMAGSPSVSSLENMLGFDMASNTATALKGNKSIIEALRSRSKKKLKRSEDYRTPGERPLEIPDVKGIKCYVLGPPKNIKLIKKLVDKEDMYLKLDIMDKEDVFMAAVVAASGTDTPEENRLFKSLTPFDNELEIEKQLAASHKDYKEFFSTHYGFTDDEKSGPEWRRIDTDWMEGADQLALNINKMTNNTSLVLAFQLTETKPRKVLLFAADAQVGNWLSWKELHWPDDEASKENFSGLDLIRQTVFYKVGHHGSLNATLKEKGLEVMDSPELVAMIPVDENWARTRGWHHPEEKLVKRLMEKTRGRVIRSDKIPSDRSLGMPIESNETEWKGFLENLEWDNSQDRLWIQFTVQ